MGVSPRSRLLLARSERGFGVEGAAGDGDLPGGWPVVEAAHGVGGGVGEGGGHEDPHGGGRAPRRRCRARRRVEGGAMGRLGGAGAGVCSRAGGVSCSC
jgi:hypothetical protein